MAYQVIETEGKSTRTSLHSLLKRLRLLACYKIICLLLRRNRVLILLFIGGMLASFAQRLLGVYNPLVLGAIVTDLVQQDSPYRNIWLYSVIELVKFGLSMVQRSISVRLETWMTQDLYSLAFDHIMDLPAEYHMNKQTSKDTSKLSRGFTVVHSAERLCFDTLPTVADSIIHLRLVYLMLGGYVFGGLISLCSLLFLVNVVFIPARAQINRDSIACQTNRNTHAYESFVYWKTVSECQNIEQEKSEHRRLSERVSDKDLEFERSSVLLRTVQELAVVLGCLVCYWQEAAQIILGRSQIGAFMTLITYWTQATENAKGIARQLISYTEANARAEEILEILERAVSTEVTLDQPQFQYKGSSLSFKDVTFSYDGSRDVLNSVSFKVSAGQKVAIVGVTGSGKSTIFNLIFRHFDPQSGSILADGLDIAGFDRRSYQANIGVVSQQPVLLSRSIMDNVRYASRDASEESVIAACKAAGIHDRIMAYEKQYNTEIKELSQTISGGEKQRLAIARLFVQNPNILLLDEPTSNLDSITEAKVMASVEEFRRGRTTLIIAHRLSTIKDADNIIVLEHGRVVEEGTHKELMKISNGVYRQMAMLQLE